MKFLLWAVLVLVVVMWLSRGKKIASGTSTTANENTDDTPAGIPSDKTEPMVCCAHCGVYLPASESVATPSGTVFCSEEHRLLHART